MGNKVSEPVIEDINELGRLDVATLISQGSLKLYAVLTVAIHQHFKPDTEVAEVADLVFESVLLVFGGSIISVPKNSRRAFAQKHKEILSLYKQGLSARQISKETDLSSSVIYKVLSDNAVTLRARKKPPTPKRGDRQADYEKLFVGGLSLEQIARELEGKVATVASRLKALKRKRVEDVQ